MNWFIGAFEKYATFSGRATRAEFWYFMLFYLLIYLALLFIDKMTGTIDSEGDMGLLTTIFSLVTLIPFLALSARRLHDIGRTGWWFLISFIPLIGLIILIIFWVQDSEFDGNEYGSYPKNNAR